MTLRGASRGPLTKWAQVKGGLGLMKFEGFLQAINILHYMQGECTTSAVTQRLILCFLPHNIS